MVPTTLLLLLAAPFVELYVLIKVGALIGAIPTIALIVFSAVLGALLLRRQGFELVRGVREGMARGEWPAAGMLEGVLVLASGVLLMVPGFVSDLIALLLLVPATRRRALRWFLARRRAAPGQDESHGRRRPYVIEGEFRREKDQ
jgi:UPF0716 protein FxsA